MKPETLSLNPTEPYETLNRLLYERPESPVREVCTSPWVSIRCQHPPQMGVRLGFRV